MRAAIGGLRHLKRYSPARPFCTSCPVCLPGKGKWVNTLYVAAGSEGNKQQGLCMLLVDSVHLCECFFWHAGDKSCSVCSPADLSRLMDKRLLIDCSYMSFLIPCKIT